MNVFQDSKIVMEKIFEQTTNLVNKPQADMYIKAVEEEFLELKTAYSEKNYKEVLDGIIDVMVTAIHLGYSLNMNVEGAWNEILQSNMAKINSITGKVDKREDGKVIKPKGWVAPQLDKFLPNF